MQIRTDCSRYSGRFVCPLCLSENLTLANDHRVEPRRDPEEMLDAFVVLMTIKWQRVLVRVAICFCHETTRNFISGNPFVGDCVNLHPIACRQQQCFGTTGLAYDGFGCGVTRELLPCFDVRGVMAQSDTEEVHGTECSPRWRAERSRRSTTSRVHTR